MHFLVLAALAAAATAAPQIVEYVHEEIAAEPYVHIEPEISPEALGIVRPAQAARAKQQQLPAPQQFAAAPVQQQQQFLPQQFAGQQQFAAPQQLSAPQQFAAPSQQFAAAPQQFGAAPQQFSAWSGNCVNNLGEGVECRQQF